MTIANSSRRFEPARLPPGAHPFRPTARIQESFLAAGERDLLQVLCRKLPAWVTPDMLTALGVAGAVLCAVGYVGSNIDPRFLFLASFGILVNWFGD
ncbi:MAG: hypothetical protein JOZ27_02530, partial [Caulobacteraceae bacterium]|nr:hypothetical protein [Caulobacteraceae bacterium]